MSFHLRAETCWKNRQVADSLMVNQIALPFGVLRRRVDSTPIVGAVASHMSFNLTMNVIIFVVLWRYIA